MMKKKNIYYSNANAVISQTLHPFSILHPVGLSNSKNTFDLSYFAVCLMYIIENMATGPTLYKHFNLVWLATMMLMYQFPS